MAKLFTLIFSLWAIAMVQEAVAQNQKNSPTVPPAPDFNQLFKPMKWRCIGPHRGGRSVAVAGVPSDPFIYYMGTTGGGLWKTEDAGISWQCVSDGFFKTGSVGAVAVAESDPNVVYTGMGEHAVRGVMTHHGDGMYKSTDGGKTWQHIGLEKTQHIARIQIHPTNPDIVWVAAQGALYGHHAERGVFKTTDGGKTWQKVLFVDEKTGCVELALDMTNPRILYAAMNEYGRKPWQVISGGAGSSLYKSTDGGENWVKINEGLPKELGKMAISVCRSNPQKLYALVESDSEKELGGLFISENAGKSWTRINDDHRLIQRAWYYIEVFADPLNDETVYVLSAPALRSTDGGKTFHEVHGVHGDYHDMWLNPRNSKNFALADDGGVAITFNFGKTFSQQHYPTAQIYRINTDNQFPYKIYGGQQDNTSVSIAHRELGSHHIGRESWTYSAGGESAFLAFNPDDPRLVLGGSYQGTIEVFDRRAAAGTNIMAAPIQYLGRDAKDCKYRFNWNAPIVWSKHEPNTFYHAAQILLKTNDLGKNWQEISPDLTRNEKEKQGRGGVPYTNEAVGAENYGTIAYVAESPHEAGVIWVGTDDGWVQLTRDGGKTWQNVTPRGLPECLVNAIEVSPHDAATAYIATTRYKFNDHSPALFKTTDFGKTWTKITSGLPENAFTRVVREDPNRRDLLFAGTELGLFISFDGGKNWSPFQLNLPITPITDLKIHQNDLIAATSGRSFWILDDLHLLQQFRQNLPDFHLFQPENAYLANGSSELDRSDDNFTGISANGGVNPANGFVCYYFLPNDVPDSLEIQLEVHDAAGAIVRNFSSKKDPKASEWEGGPSLDPVLPAKKGLNRFVWDMRYPTLPGVPGTYFENSFRGHKASPGKYFFILKLNEKTASTAAEILPNPLYPKDLNYQEYHEIMLDMEQKVAQMHQLILAADAKRQQLDDLLATLPSDEPRFKNIHETGKLLSEKMKRWDEDMVQRKSKAYDDVENYPNKFSANYLFLLNQTESDIPRVNEGSRQLKRQLDTEWEGLLRRITEILEREVPAFNQLLWQAGVGGIWKN